MSVLATNPKSYHNLSALGSCAVFVVFRKISVKQKPHRAHTTFDLEQFFLTCIAIYLKLCKLKYQIANND